MTHPVTRQVADLCATLASQPGLDPAEADQIRSCAAELDQPLRLAVVGRIKAGKSTLVNALIGRRTAATAAGECTQVVTEYRFGAPDRAEVIDVDGQVHPLPFADPAQSRLPADLQLADGRRLAAAEVDHLRVWLSSAPLREITLVDTPGLSSAGNTDAVSVRAAGNADALIFCFREAERAEEIRFLEQFRGASGAFQAFGVNALGVLCQADLVGSDPVQDAQRLAGRMASEHRHLVAEVIPVSGLLAQTARTGQIDELVARRLATRDPEDELAAFLDPPSSQSDEEDRLMELLGPWGIAHGAAHSCDAATLISWLDAASGVAALEHHIARLLPLAPVLKAMRILAEVQRRCRASSQAVRLGGLIEKSSLAPEAWALRALPMWQLLARARPTSPALPELWSAIVWGPDAWLRRCDLNRDQRAREVLSAATFALEPAEARAWRTLGRAYQSR